MVWDLCNFLLVNNELLRVICLKQIRHFHTNFSATDPLISSAMHLSPRTIRLSKQIGLVKAELDPLLATS